MATIIGSFVLALLLQGPANLQVGPDTKVPERSTAAIPKGTRIPVQLLAKLSTKTLKEGDGVYAMTIFPITLNNEIVIPVGSNVQGKVTQVDRPGKVKGKAGLALSFQTIILPSGTNIPLFASLAGSSDAETAGSEGKLKGESSKGADAAKVGTATLGAAGLGRVLGGTRTAGIGAAGGASGGLAAVLLTRGKDLTLDRGATLEIVLDRPLIPTD